MLNLNFQQLVAKPRKYRKGVEAFMPWKKVDATSKSGGSSSPSQCATMSSGKKKSLPVPAVNGQAKSSPTSQSLSPSALEDSGLGRASAGTKRSRERQGSLPGVCSHGQRTSGRSKGKLFHICFEVCKQKNGMIIIVTTLVEVVSRMCFSLE